MRLSRLQNDDNRWHAATFLTIVDRIIARSEMLFGDSSYIYWKALRSVSTLDREPFAGSARAIYMLQTVQQRLS